MPKVTNLTNRGIPLFRYRLLPKSHKAMTPQGKTVEWLPAEVAYSKRAKDLHNQGLVEIAGLAKPKAVKVETAPPKAESKPTKPVYKKKDK